MSINKSYLELLEKKYKNVQFINTDPLRYLYLFQDKKDKEIIALIVALFSYGNIKAIFQFLDQLVKLLSPNPYKKLREFDEKIHLNFYYRFQSSKDIKYIFLIFKKMLHYEDEFIFKNLFYDDSFNNETNIYKYIDIFIKNINKIIPKKYLTNGVKHYFCLGNHNSILKRYCLFFRWMVRHDFPDSGIYYFINTNQLVYPLDTHIHKFCLEHNIINSKTLSRKNAIEITNYFKQFNKNDPLKYDFYITRELILKNTFR